MAVAALAPAAISAIGQMGAAALTAPPQQNISGARSDAVSGVGSAPFGDFIVYGGGQIAPTAELTRFGPAQIVTRGGSGSADKMVLYIAAGGLLLWLVFSKL